MLSGEFLSEFPSDKSTFDLVEAQGDSFKAKLRTKQRVRVRSGGGSREVIGDIKNQAELVPSGGGAIVETSKE